MSATNATTYYELPVFIATDKPAWLTDWNGAMNAIDTAIKEALTAGENAQTTANTATSSIATINDSLTTINTSLTTLTSTVTGLTGSVNTINSLIGNGEPTTSDKTLIGAINEIYAMIGGGTEVDADIVAYDNTTSGLTATNVQDAIDELASAPAPTQEYDFDLTAYQGDCTITPTSDFSIDATLNSVKYALNADKTICKIYGVLQIASSGASTSMSVGWNKLATLSASDLPTRASSYSIVLGIAQLYRGSSWDGNSNIRLTFNTDGTIDIELYERASESIKACASSLPACVYFLDQAV